MIIFNKQIFQGEMVDASAFIPTTRAAQLGNAALVASSAYIANDIGMTLTSGSAAVLASLMAGWTYHRIASAGARGGFFLDKPRQVRKAKPAVNFNIELTEHFQKLGAGFENCVVTEQRAPQHKVFVIPNLDPEKVERQMKKISMLLNVSDQAMNFYQNWGKGQSAILVPAKKDQWQDVHFDPSALDSSKLQLFLGRGIRGEAFVIDLEDDPFGLVAGKTGAGKTNLVRSALKSLPLSDIKSVVYIMDPKEDAQLMREPCDWHSTDIPTCIAKLEALYTEGETRQAKYSAAGCDNYFEYQRKVDPSEPAIFVLADEMADYFEPDLTEKLEKDEYPLHKRALSIFSRFLRKRRSSGIFIMGCIQDPKAEIMSTNTRNNFTFRISLMVSDAAASKVAMGMEKAGAERLPPKGGMLFKTNEQKVPALGRAAII